MDCGEGRFVAAFVAGQLPQAAIVAMEAHLEACEGCFARMAELAALLPSDVRTSFAGRSCSGSRVRSLLSSDAPISHETSPDSDGGSGAFEQPSLGPYAIVGLLGSGGMGVVFRARHVSTGKLVAVKTVKSPQLAAFSALRQEIAFLKQARHPGIVEILEYDLNGRDPWYAMELLEGDTLADRKDATWKGISAGSGRAAAAAGQLREVLQMYIDLCDPVGFIHGAGIVHCDLKPSNVFLRANDSPVLVDFGLVTRTWGGRGRETLNVSGRVRGTLPYMAPEVIRGQLPDARADLYSIGCMLFESVTGAPPFAAEIVAEVMQAHLWLAPPLASSRVDGVPPELDELLMRLLAKDPRSRLGHAAALSATLSVCADGLLPMTASRQGRRSARLWGPAYLFRPNMVGREAELADLSAAISDPSETSGALFLISGESGIGKTFFASEVSQRALLAGVRVVTGECHSLAPTAGVSNDVDTAPLRPFHRMLEAIGDQCRERGAAETTRLLGGHLGLLAAYEPSFAHLPGAVPGDHPSPLPALAARQRLMAALAETLGSFAERRRVLITIDDIQWADDLSLAFLDSLSDEFFRNTPVVILATYRSDESSDAIRRLAAKTATRRLHLERLKQSETAGMIAAMLAMPTLPEPLVDFVHAHAEGVPFFAAEYLRALVQERALILQRGSWALDVEAGSALTSKLVSLPTDLAELVGRRLAGLSPDVRDALETAAVLGRTFESLLLGRILNRPPAQLEASLSAAIEREIIELSPSGGYRFLHDKIRETLYAGVEPPRLATMHLDVARTLEQHCGAEELDDRYGQIAHHFRLAGQTPQAIHYLERGGERALDVAACADAERFFREALELDASLTTPATPLTRARWQRQRGDALQGLGLMSESAVALGEAGALLNRPLPAGKAALAVRILRELGHQLLHRLLPRLFLGRRTKAALLLQETARVFDRMHRASYYLGRDADLVVSTTVSLNAAESAPPIPELATAYANAGATAGVLPAPGLADRYFKLAADSLARLPDPATESWLHLMEGAYRTGRGQRARAIKSFDRAIALAEQLAFFRRRDEAKTARAGVDIMAGDHAVVGASIATVERACVDRGDAQLVSWALAQRLECLILNGRYDEAPTIFALARTLPAHLGRPERIWLVGLEAFVRYQMNEHEQAFELAAQAQKLVEQGPPVHWYCIDAYACIAKVALARLRDLPDPSRRGAYLRSAQRACATLRGAAKLFPIARPIAVLHAGHLALHLGAAPVKVAPGWARAAADAAQMELPIHEARLREALAALPGLPDGLTRDNHARAVALYRSLDAVPDGGAARALSAREVDVERKAQPDQAVL
jgi:eukaryotic-like serine/threonine-protein kinase